MQIRTLIGLFSRLLTPVLPIERLITLTGQDCILPFYHAVSDDPPPHLKHVLKIRDSKRFEQDLDFLLKHFVPADAGQLLEQARGNPVIGKPRFHLTFDDGLKECSGVIAPVLRRKGIPATFFLNTGFIGNRDMFFRYRVSLLIDRLPALSQGQEKAFGERLSAVSVPPGHLEQRLLAVLYHQKEVLDQLAEIAGLRLDEYATRQEVYMSHDDIKGLLESGFSIGSHGIDHPLFRMLPDQERHRQVQTSLEYLKEHFRVSPALFSFPFSDEGVPAQFFRQLYPPEGMVDLSFGISGLKKDVSPFHLHRIPMETGNHPARQIIAGEYGYYLLKALIGKNIINRP